MISRTDAWALSPARVRERAADYLALVKPRVVGMVLVTTAVGFYLGSRGALDYAGLLLALLGTGLAAGGTMALNQFLERDVDARMERTRLRPLPDGRLQPLEGLAFGAGLTVAGVLVLGLGLNWLSGLVTAVTAASYLFLYTPLKRRTPLCTVVGAISGGLPPVTGWAAAGGGLGLEPGILFAILFLWQMPHTLAIGSLYREDYARAGIRVLPVVDADGRSTGLQIVTASLALLVVALLPTLVGLAGPVYFVGALALGLAFLGTGIPLARARSAGAAWRLMVASLIYLPALLTLLVLGKGPS